MESSGLSLHPLLSCGVTSVSLVVSCHAFADTYVIIYSLHTFSPLCNNNPKLLLAVLAAT